MTTVERKGKIKIEINIDPFLLFLLTSVLIHGVGLLILVFSNRSLPTARQETESTPIDFVVVPPEESPEQPPPDTKRKAVNNSVAKGKVDPELPSATDKIGSEEAIATSEPTQATQPDIQESPSVPNTPPNSEPPKPQPIAPPPSLTQVPKPTPPSLQQPKPVEQSQQLLEQSPPVTPPPIAKVPKPAIEKPDPISPPEEIKPAPPPAKKPKPLDQTPLLSESDSTSIPLPKPLSPPAEEPPKEIETVAPRPDLPPQTKPIEPPIQPEEKPSREIETATPQPNLPPVATNLPPKPKPIDPPSSVPDTTPNPPLEQETPVGSGAASLLGGTYRKTLSEDSGSSFFAPQANASQQAFNPSGRDAQQDLDLGPYFDEIRRRVKRNWKPSSPGDNRHTVLAFSIQRNGQITGLQVIQSSGSERVDRESLEAVQKSGPFDALPANFPQEQLNVEFNFNIYVNRGVFTPQLENWQRF